MASEMNFNQEQMESFINKVLEKKMGGSSSTSSSSFSEQKDQAQLSVLEAIIEKKIEEKLERIFGARAAKKTNEQPVFFEKTCSLPLATFEQLYDTGIQMEDVIATGMIDTGTKKVVTRRSAPYGYERGPAPKAKKINGAREAPRRFSQLDMPLSKVLAKLIRKGLLKPLAPRPPPAILPNNYDHSAYCEFHQVKGHYTDKCSRLRHEIQDLIDDGTIPNPESAKPKE